MSEIALQDYLLATLTKGQRTRLRILESGLACFVRKGFEGGSVSELARAATTNRAQIAHYFRSKEKLIDECFTYIGITGRSVTDSEMRKLPDELSLTERYLRATFAWQRQHPLHAAYLLLSIQRATYHAGTRLRIRENFEHSWQGIEGRLLADATSGKARLEGASPLELSRQIHAALLGGISLAIVDSSDDNLPYERRCVDSVRRMIGATP